MPFDVSDTDTLEVSFPFDDFFISTTGNRLIENLLLTRLMVELFPSKAEAASLLMIGKAAAGVITFGLVSGLFS